MSDFFNFVDKISILWVYLLEYTHNVPTVLSLIFI